MFKITEVRIKLMGACGGPDPDPAGAGPPAGGGRAPGSERLRAFASITLDDAFVVRDLKVIDGPRGLFLCMPARKMADHCGHCRHKNHMRARYCNECGGRLDERRALVSERTGRLRLHADIAHPVHRDAREMIEDVVLDAYHDEVELAGRPGYVSTYDEYGEGLPAA